MAVAPCRTEPRRERVAAQPHLALGLGLCHIWDDGEHVPLGRHVRVILAHARSSDHQLFVRLLVHPYVNRRQAGQRRVGCRVDQHELRSKHDVAITRNGHVRRRLGQLKQRVRLVEPQVRVGVPQQKVRQLLLQWQPLLRLASILTRGLTALHPVK